MRYLGIDPGFRKSLGYVIVEVPPEHRSIVRIPDAGIVDLSRIPLRVAASILRDRASAHRVTEALIEDFLFLGNREKNRAPWRLVARMQNLIGYLSGFLSASGIPTTKVPPKRWRSRTHPEHLSALLKSSGHHANPHTVSALGIVLGELAARKTD